VKLYFLQLPDADFAIRRVESRIRLGGHAIPPDTIRRRFARGLRHLRNEYLGLVDEWSLYDASHNPPRLIDTGNNRAPDTVMEDSTEYHSDDESSPAVKPLNDPDFIGAEAALRRAAAKAVAQARAAGLEPVVAEESVARHAD